MHHTTNRTTSVVGQTVATVLAHTTHADSTITTWELVYPRYIHADFMSHRKFSRNGGSSRATPTKTLINEVRTKPMFFDEVRRNKSGMVGGELLPLDELAEFKGEWFGLANYVADVAERWCNKYGLAKQTVNRILEPFLPIRMLCTTTEVDNFFNLRLARDAQPEIRSLAVAMRSSLDTYGDPDFATAHIPYSAEFGDLSESDMLTRCVASCARVTVMRSDGKETTLEDDKRLVDKLWQSRHLTPFEHIAFTCDGSFYNLDGWKSLRYMLDEEGHEPWW